MRNAGLPRAAWLVCVVAALMSGGAGAQVQWVKTRPVTSPGARAYHAMVYDSVRRRILLAGGTVIQTLNDTWRWNGITWTQYVPGTSPPAGSYAMAYDSGRGRAVIFGGNPYQNPAETWEWDGARWTKRTPATSPPGRTGHAMAYDPTRRQVVLFGGLVQGGALNHTWEWDGTDWRERRPTASPPSRLEHAMVYDASRRQVILFGGRNAGMVGDTWAWQGSTWIRLAPAAAPAPRCGHAMAYDSTIGRVVLFGGRDGTGIGANYFNDTWLWDGAAWARTSPVNPPTARAFHAMAYDDSRQRMVLFGGYAATTSGARLEGDTWSHAGTHLVGSGPSRPGGQRNLALYAGLDPGRPYQVGSSLGTGPIALGGLTLDLAPDPILAASVAGVWPGIFQGYRGAIGVNGIAAATIKIPAAPFLVGQTIHSAFVTFRPIPPAGLRSVSNTESFRIQP
jgi:hypothetical protein